MSTMFTVRQLLTEICKEEGFDIIDDVLFDIVAEQPKIQETDRDEHRWYTNVRSVVEITFNRVAYYIEYMDCYPKGEDTDAEDCGFDIDIDSMKFVYPHQEMVTVYK